MLRRPHILVRLFLMMLGLYFCGAYQLRSWQLAETLGVHLHLASHSEDDAALAEDHEAPQEEASHVHHHRHRHGPEEPVHEHSHPHIPALEGSQALWMTPAPQAPSILPENKLVYPHIPRQLHSASLLDAIFRPPIV